MKVGRLFHLLRLPTLSTVGPEELDSKSSARGMLAVDIVIWR